MDWAFPKIHADAAMLTYVMNHLEYFNHARDADAYTPPLRH